MSRSRRCPRSGWLTWDCVVAVPTKDKASRMEDGLGGGGSVRLSYSQDGADCLPPVSEAQGPARVSLASSLPPALRWSAWTFPGVETVLKKLLSWQRTDLGPS